LKGEHVVFALAEEKKNPSPPLDPAADIQPTGVKENLPFVKGRYWNYEEDRYCVFT
jgi:hypothetical protein